MTDARDSCFGCGGHLRRNAYSGSLCPECMERHERGEITMFGDPLDELRERYVLTEVRGDPFLRKDAA